MAKTPDGFVSLKSLKHGPSSPRDTLALLRRIYFKTKKETIEHDFAHAIELLKTIASEDDRQKASVFMEGINELRKEWTPKAPRKPGAPAGGRARSTPKKDQKR